MIVQQQGLLAGLSNFTALVVVTIALAKALMTDLQKRVMLKLLAVSAFLNHRDLRDSSAASVRRLRDDTDRVLAQTLTSESRAPLKTICTQASLAESITMAGYRRPY